MKNKHIEYKIKKSKHYAKSWAGNRQLNEQGNYIAHCYDEPKELSWWDDVFFKLGSQVIAIWWIHPRQHYQDLCEQHIDEQMPFPDLSADEIMPSTPNYKKLGKNGNRKKIISYTSSGFHPEFLKHCEQKRQATNELLKTGDVIAKPFIRIQQFNWCRGVDLCIPIEVLNENDVNKLVEIAKQLITRQATIDELFPNYQYDKHRFLAEQK